MEGNLAARESSITGIPADGCTDGWQVGDIVSMDVGDIVGVQVGSVKALLCISMERAGFDGRNDVIWVG